MTARRRAKASPRAAVLAGLGGVALAVALVVLFVNLSSTEGSLELGEEVFEAGRADRLARTIARDGPVLYPDPLKRSAGRNLYIQHLADSPTEGWLAFEAQVSDPRCQVVWSGRDERFTDPCTNRTFPADGAGLRQYPVEVMDGTVVVDLRPQ